ncbi:MAG TPA: hypothetical protein PKM16_09475 [Bacteroidia bacterium]|nr:hypothetical protein [Bacteroidia bacterium]HNS11891.1 hypothetical protein [Bacteroidia bacterium]
MKKILLSFIFLFSSFTSKSQYYQSLFGQDSTQWFTLTEVIDAALTYRYHTIAGIDSTLNGNVYMKVFNDFQTTGLIREDTVSGKTWYYSLASQSEKIIMDLTLQLGDTFLIHTLWMDSIPVLVDSVFLINGIKHIRLDFPLLSFTTKLEFIEGSGPNAGITYQGETHGWNYISDQLLCKYTDTTQVYANDDFNGRCDVMLIGIPEVSKESKIKVYPNPVKRNQWLNFEYTDDSIRSIQMLDVFGKSDLLLDKNQYRISQPSGIYCILVSYLSGKKERIKLIVIE